MAGQFDLKWQPVQASDPSRLLAASQEAVEAYNKAIKDQIKVFDTMFNNAQQHKMNEVQQAVNAFSLDDYNAPDARAKFDEIVANASKEIGGFNAANQLTMDTIWDNRGKTLIDKGIDQLNYNKSARTEATDVRQYDAESTANVVYTLSAMLSDLPTDSEEYKNISTQIQDILGKFTSKHPDGVELLNAALDKIDSDRLAREQDRVNKLVDLDAPVYFDYIGKAAELSARRAQAESLQGDERTIALNKIALDEAALQKRYGADFIKSLQDPRVLARMEQYAYDMLTKRQISEAEYKKTIADIENARKALEIKKQAVEVQEQAVKVQAQDVANRHTVETDKNALTLYRIQNEIQNRGGGSSGRSSSEVKAATDRNVGRLTSMGVSKALALSFIGEDGEVNPSKVLASVLNQANRYKIEENNGNLYNKDAMPYTSWVIEKAPALAKAAGVSNAELGIYKKMADTYAVGNDLLKRAIVEAGIAGRLNEFSEGDGFGLADGLAMELNTWQSTVEYVLTKKGMLEVLKAEIADNAFHPSAQNFRTIMAAVDVAYEGGFDKFVQDNAATLHKNAPFMQYVDQETRNKVVDAINSANGNRSSPNHSIKGPPHRNAGQTFGLVPQPTSFPKPSSNTSVMTGLPRSTPNGGNNSKPQSSPKPASNSNANNGQGNKTIKTGQSGNNWERTKQRYLPDWLRN